MPGRSNGLAEGLLHLTAAGQTLDVPMMVVPTAGPEATAGQAKLLVCLPPPDVPVGSPGRAQFGAKLLSATFGVNAITQPASSGDFTWTSLFTPYNPGVGTVNAAGSVETQSIRHIPTQLKLNYARKKVVTFRKVKGKRIKTVSTKVTFSSAASESGKPAAGTITTVAGGKKVGGAKGSFTFKGKSVTLTATADLHKGAAVPTGAVTDEHRPVLRGPRSCGLHEERDLRRPSLCRRNRGPVVTARVRADRRLHEVETVSYPDRCHVGTGQDRNVLVGGRRAREALVPRGHAAA